MCYCIFFWSLIDPDIQFFQTEGSLAPCVRTYGCVLVPQTAVLKPGTWVKELGQAGINILSGGFPMAVNEGSF